MARYEHLPIYRKGMELCVYLESTVRHFSRYHKYTLGTELRDTAREILRLIVRANSRTEKQKVLETLVEQCEVLKMTLVLAKEVNAFSSFKAFQHASGLIITLCKQSEGWLKGSRNSRNYQPPLKRAGR